MNARFSRYVTGFLAIFVAGALYGVCWEQYWSGDDVAIGPATPEELAQVRAAATKFVRLHVSIPVLTNADLPAKP